MGRVKSFNQEEVQNQITNVFWKKGYENTSISDLTSETGLAKMSLYHSFGNKEEMFVKSLKTYSDKTNHKWSKKAEGLSFLQDFFGYLKSSALKEKNSKGCFIMNSALELMQTQGIKAELSKDCWNFLVKNFTDAVTAAVEKGELKKSTEIEKLSKWLLSQAFTIRQFSRFVTDASFYEEIQNNVTQVLKEHSI